jgi:membrane fusion protein (multidrug efflux system)
MKMADIDTRRMRRAGGLIFASVLLLLQACGKPAVPPERLAPEVTTLTLQSESIQLQTELPGRVSAQSAAEVRPQVGGIVRARLFEEGSMVRAGQTLFQIDPAPYAAALERAEAALASSEAATRISELQLRRYRTLLPESSISQQDFDNAEAAHAQALATTRERSAAVSTARIDLAWTRVAAPIAGRIGRSLVTPGALVSANQIAPLATITQLDPVHVDVTQSSADLLRLRRAALSGQIDRSSDVVRSVGLVLEDDTRYNHAGVLRLTEVEVEQSTGAVTLRAEFPNPQGLLLPGMYVRAIVTEGVNGEAIVVPQSALSRDRQGGAIVRIVDAAGKIELREVVATRAIGHRWLVEEGLAAGERIVVEGGQNARPGTTVRIATGQ